MPRDGILTSIAVYFSTVLALSLIESTVTLQAQLYSSTTPDNIFTAITGTTVQLSPGLSGNVSIGTVSYGMATGLNIPLTAQTRLILVISGTATGLLLTNTVIGYASAGINIV